MFFESIPHLNEDILINIAKLVIKYAEIVQKKRNTPVDEKKFVTYKLFEYRNKFYSFFKNISK